MAKYKKVKRYHRSFYSPGMWAKKVVGIVVLVAVVLVVGWLAAPHVLDWATHTWYTVVRNRVRAGSVQRGRFVRGGGRACGLLGGAACFVGTRRRARQCHH